jgi:apolipoprotein N-acyltransferase
VLDPRLALDAARRGAALIVTLSNDSWFAAGPGPRMHLVGAAFLSVETRRPQVRATNTGISAIIDATGEIVASAGVDERAVLTEAVRPLAAPPTVVVRWGEWVGPTGLVAAALFLAIDTLRSGRRGADGRGARRGGRDVRPSAQRARRGAA